MHRPGRTVVLTVRYEQLGLRPGDRLLDLGCGGGRHAFEAARRGARVVAVDADLAEVKEVAAAFAASANEACDGSAAAALGSAVGGHALALPFADATFDRIIAAEVLEHLPDDLGATVELARVLRPGGTLAVTVPSWWPERLCWALSEDYHAPAVPGGHLRIYTTATLEHVLGRAGFSVVGRHRAHALHSPYWWLRCAVGPTDEGHRAVAAYHRVLVWELMRRPRSLRLVEAALNPVLGKSLVVYAGKAG